MSTKKTDQQALDEYLRECRNKNRFDGHDCQALDAKFSPFLGHVDCAACRSAIMVQQCGPDNEFEVVHDSPDGRCENRDAHLKVDFHCCQCLSTNTPSGRRLCDDCRFDELREEHRANVICVHARFARMALERYVERLKVEPDAGRIRQSLPDISTSLDLLWQINREFMPNLIRSRGVA